MNLCLAGRPTGDLFLTFLTFFDIFRKLGVPPFFQECPVPDMTLTSLVLLFSRSGIKLRLVPQVLTTDTPPSETDPVHHFCFLHVFSTFGEFLEKLVKNVKKSGLQRSADPFFSIFWHFWTPPGVPPLTPPGTPIFGIFVKKWQKKGFLDPPPDPPQNDPKYTVLGGLANPKKPNDRTNGPFYLPDPPYNK